VDTAENNEPTSRPIQSVQRPCFKMF